VTPYDKRLPGLASAVTWFTVEYDRAKPLALERSPLEQVCMWVCLCACGCVRVTVCLCGVGGGVGVGVRGGEAREGAGGVCALSKEELPSAGGR